MEEKLAYEQVISRNESSALQSTPSGRIGIRLPYDGATCFGRDARDDAKLHLGKSATTDEAVVGHIVFVEHEETDLDAVLGFTGTFGRFPLRVPIRSAELRNPTMLTADRFAYHADISYRPSSEGPEVVPLKVSVEIFDPGHQDRSFLKDSAIEAVRRDPRRQRSMARVIKESAEFQPYLTARIRVRLSLPAQRQSDAAVSSPPVVRSVRVTLPENTTIPLSSVQLYDVEERRLDKRTLQINTRAGSFEWFDEPMTTDAITDDAPRRYQTSPVDVRFLQPGELFRQREISVDVAVELPNELLSGAQVRYFDAAGNAPKRGAATPLQVRTIISAQCTVLLYDAFTRRQISPSQSFCFEEIVPEEQRVNDVVTTLVDQRFTVELQVPLEGNGKKRVEHLIIATRRDGPRTIQLWIFVEGRRYPTERESRHPWGHRYRSKFESGSLKVHVRGLVFGDARGVTREINTLHLALHDRFQRMKALR